MRPLDGHYFRRHGLRVPLPGLPGSTEFNEAYAQALDEAPAPAVIGASRTIPGSVNAMIVGYLGSAAFHHLAPSSQAQYGRIFENMRREHGDKSIAKLERRHVVTMLNAKAATPIGARDFLRCLRLLIAYGIGIGIRADDPTLGLRVKLPKSDGYRTWTEDDIAAVEAAYPIGSKPGLGPPCVAPTWCASGGVTSATARSRSRSRRPRPRWSSRSLPPWPKRSTLRPARQWCSC
jgi:hypothetical protein